MFEASRFATLFQLSVDLSRDSATVSTISHRACTFAIVDVEKFAGRVPRWQPLSVSEVAEFGKARAILASGDNRSLSVTRSLTRRHNLAGLNAQQPAAT